MTGSAPRALRRLVMDTATADGTSEAAAGSDVEREVPEASPYLAGEVIGDRYRLVRELGRGGMGVVWIAHSLVLDVDVALKLIRASAAAPGVASRMAREAHAAARLGHPALVRVFDFGWTQRGDPFLVMELVQGETLAVLLARELRIPAIRAVQMLLPIADGLRLAHERSIVHRDIKPENIFLASDALGRQQPKLLDFGIAKVDQSQDGKITQFGAVLGSPDYMSPEQALGLDDIDQRTDVWSFCIVLYELITGGIPFRRSNYNALMHAIINEPPTPSHEYGAGDAALWLVIERGLSKTREQRWANMSELGEALALWLYEHGIKEDLSGNSIRAVWLDAALTGVRMDVPPSTPPGPGDGRPTPSARRGLSGASLRSSATRQRRSQDAAAPAPGSALTPVRLGVLGIGAALLGAVLMLFAYRWSAPATAPPPLRGELASSNTPSPRGGSAALEAEPASPPMAAPALPPSRAAAPPLAGAKTTGTARTSANRTPALKRSHDFGF